MRTDGHRRGASVRVVAKPQAVDNVAAAPAAADSAVDCTPDAAVVVVVVDLEAHDGRGGGGADRMCLPSRCWRSHSDVAAVDDILGEAEVGRTPVVVEHAALVDTGLLVAAASCC
jgi:hypothetical protein